VAVNFAQKRQILAKAATFSKNCNF